MNEKDEEEKGVVHADSRERNGELRYETCPLGRNFCLPQQAEVPINRARILFRSKGVSRVYDSHYADFDSIVEKQEQVATEVSNTQRRLEHSSQHGGHYIAVN
jgi:hypothetical protein